MKSSSVVLQNKQLFCVSALFSICGLGFICFWPVILDLVLTLRKVSFTYEFWKALPVAVKTEFHFFNWTNPQDFYNLSVKPKFEETGPYRFWQTEKKANITWNDNGTVTYKQIKYWSYDNQGKNGNLEDKISTINPVPLGASYILRNWNYYIKKSLFFMLHPILRNLVITPTARELLFEGYREPLIKVVRAIPIFDKYNFPNWDRFGWLYTRNGSSEFDGTFNMGTGVNSTFGEIQSWDSQKRTPYFDGSCAEISGSAGNFFPRNLKKDYITFFSSDLRRSVNFTFQKEEFVAGILGYKYIAADRMFDNGTIYPQNRCYCNGECLPSGMVNLSNTRHGFPLFVSLPHFYRADPYYGDLIEGMKPDPSKHEMSFTIEPTTGIPLKAAGRLQANMLVQPIPGVLMFDDAPKFMLPVLWTSAFCEVEGFHAFLVWVLVNISVICVTAGVSMIVVSTGGFAYVVYRRQLKQLQTQRSMELLKQNVPLQTCLHQK